MSQKVLIIDDESDTILRLEEYLAGHLTTGSFSSVRGQVDRNNAYQGVLDCLNAHWDECNIILVDIALEGSQASEPLASQKALIEFLDDPKHMEKINSCPPKKYIVFISGKGPVGEIIDRSTTNLANTYYISKPYLNITNGAKIGLERPATAVYCSSTICYNGRKIQCNKNECLFRSIAYLIEKLEGKS
jgi:hypothetical protein